MDAFTLQVTPAALSLVALAVAVAAAMLLHTIPDEGEALDDSDTKTIVKFRLLESRVAELETTVATLEMWRDSVVGVPDVVDLRAELTAARRNADSRLIRIPNADD